MDVATLATAAAANVAPEIQDTDDVMATVDGGRQVLARDLNPGSAPRVLYCTGAFFGLFSLQVSKTAVQHPRC